MNRIKARELVVLLAIFVILCVLWFPRVFLGEVFVGAEVLAGEDLINHYIPQKAFFQSSIKWGTFPLWNPHIFCGRPFYADVQIGVFYPPNWLFVIMDVPRAFTLLALAHLFFAFWGSYAFARLFLDKRLSRLLVALVFVFSAFFIARFFPAHFITIFTAAWFPWILFFTEKLHRKRTLRAVIPLSLAIGLQILAGGAQIAFYTLFAVVLYELFNYLWERRAERIEGEGNAGLGLCVGFVGLAIAGGIMLAAVQIVPSAEFVSNSFERAGAAPWDYVVDGSLSFKHLLTFLLPSLFHNPIYPQRNWAGVEGYWEVNAYAGIATVFLLFLGIFNCSRFWKEMPGNTRRVFLFSLFMVVLSLALAAGKHSLLFKLCYWFIPGFNRFRDPARILLLYVFGLALITGIVFEQILLALERGAAEPRSRIAKRSLIAGVVLLLPGVAALAFLNPLLDALRLSDLRPNLSPEDVSEITATASHSLWLFLALVLGATVIALLGLSGRSGKPRLWKLLLPALVALDLWFFGARFPQTAGRATLEEMFYPKTDVSTFLETHKDEGRFCYLDNVFDSRVDQNQLELYADRPIMYGLYDARGYDPILLRWYGKFANVMAGRAPDAPTGAMLKIRQVGSPPLLSLLNVKYLLSYRELREPFALVKSLPFGLKIYENPGAKGWAYFMHHVDAEGATEGAIFTILGGGKMPVDKMALVDRKPLEDHVSPTAEASTGSSTQAPKEENVTLLSRSAARHRYEVSARSVRLLVFSETYYADWCVWIDGKPAPLVKVNATFPGVYVPPGRHVVELAFVPKRLFLGAAISGIALLSLIALFIHVWRQAGFRGHAPRATNLAGVGQDTKANLTAEGAK